MSKPRAKRQSGQFVTPGERLGVIEEFTPGQGTYVDQGGIRAKVSGNMLLDLQKKIVSIYPLVQRTKIPKVGSIVTGQVSNLQNKTANLRISKIGSEQLSGFFGGMLYISDVSNAFVDSIHDVAKPGDVVRAKVISEKNGVYHLSTKDSNLGVLHSYCSRCGGTLQKKRYKMHCPKCGNIEKRHVAADHSRAS
jgi:exosome complex component CSL4